MKNPFGHKHSFNPDHYGRFRPNYAPIDALGTEHRIVENRCVDCDEWVQICMIHLPIRETERTDDLSN